MTLNIAITNLKGGVGKSTISRNLAVYFARKGEKVCLIDTDITQRGTCEWAERREEGAVKVDVFPMSTIGALPKDLKTHQENGYTIIIMDGTPHLEEVTTKMILVSDIVLIPLTPSIEDLKSCEKFLKHFHNAEAVLDGVREILAFLVLNQYSGRNNEDLEMKEAVKLFKDKGIQPLKATLDNRIAHRRASKYGLTALEWEDKKAEKEVQKFCSEFEREIIKRLEE